MTATAPGFLIAMPTLRDPNFAEAVVLMLEHTKDGAIGVIINRSFPGEHDTVCRGLGIEWPARSLGGLRFGGPVRTQAGCIVHPPSVMFFDSQLITPEIAVSTSREALDGMLAHGTCPFRLMLGYSGWGPGQLERELVEGAWLLAPTSDRTLFETPVEAIYDRALGSLGIRRQDLAVAPSAAIH
jgi:putative transcriptional regulator